MRVLRRITRKIVSGFTLVELVVTIAITAIMMSMLGVFLYFYIDISNKMADYRVTYENADLISLNIIQFIDSNNDGNLEVYDESSSGSLPTSYDSATCTPLLTYKVSESSTNLLYYNHNTLELIYHDRTLITGVDDTLGISIESNPSINLVRFVLTFGEELETMSFIKQLY